MYCLRPGICSKSRHECQQQNRQLVQSLPAVQAYLTWLGSKRHLPCLAASAYPAAISIPIQSSTGELLLAPGMPSGHKATSAAEADKKDGALSRALRECCAPLPAAVEAVQTALRTRLMILQSQGPIFVVPLRGHADQCSAASARDCVNKKVADLVELRNLAVRVIQGVLCKTSTRESLLRLRYDARSCNKKSQPL